MQVKNKGKNHQTCILGRVVGVFFKVEVILHANERENKNLVVEDTN